MSLYCPNIQRLGWNRSSLTSADARSYCRMPMRIILSLCRSVEEFVMFNVSGKQECVKQCIKEVKKEFVLGQIGEAPVNLDLLPVPNIPVSRFALSEMFSVHVFSERYGLYAGFTAGESNKLLADHIHTQGLMYTVQLPTAECIAPLLSPLVGLCALELDNCASITTQTLAALLHASFLQSLSLTNNHTLHSLLPEDYHLHHNAQMTPCKLTSLTFNDFSAVFMMSLVEFTVRCPLLQDLSLYLMPHADKGKVKKLRKKVLRDSSTSH